MTHPRLFVLLHIFLLFAIGILLGHAFIDVVSATAVTTSFIVNATLLVFFTVCMVRTFKLILELVPYVTKPSHISLSSVDDFIATCTAELNAVQELSNQHRIISRSSCSDSAEIITVDLAAGAEISMHILSVVRACSKLVDLLNKSSASAIPPSSDEFIH